MGAVSGVRGICRGHRLGGHVLILVSVLRLQALPEVQGNFWGCGDLGTVGAKGWAGQGVWPLRGLKRGGSYAEGLRLQTLRVTHIWAEARQLHFPPHGGILEGKQLPELLTWAGRLWHMGKES